MTQKFSNIENLKSLDFWKKEVKSIKLNDILIWIAIILMFLAAYQNIDAGRNPCEYCKVNLPYEEGGMTCKEYFENYGTGANSDSEVNIENENFTLNHT